MVASVHFKVAFRHRCDWCLLIIGEVIIKSMSACLPLTKEESLQKSFFSNNNQTVDTNYVLYSFHTFHYSLFPFDDMLYGDIYIYVYIYIYIRIYMVIYIYIYMCVCVCVPSYSGKFGSNTNFRTSDPFAIVGSPRPKPL